MPFVSERLETGIIHQQFSGHFHMSEFENSQRNILALEDTHHDKQVVVILDFTNALVSPRELDITRARRAIDANRAVTIGYVIVGAPQGVRLFSKIVKRVINLNIVHVDRLDEALEKSRDVIKKFCISP